MKLHHRHTRLAAAALLCCSIFAAPQAWALYEIDGGYQAESITNSVSTNTVYVGRYSSGNSLAIINGGSLVANQVRVGYVEPSGDNTLLVSGSNSLLQASQTLSVGNGGTGNSLSIEDGAWVVVGQQNTGVQTNVAAGGIIVGNSDGSAQLSLGNGAEGQTENLYIGTEIAGSGKVSLSGTDTSMVIANDLYLGYAGSSNTIAIASGATLTVSNLLQIGSATGSSNVMNIESGGKAVVLGTVNIADPASNYINITNGGHLAVSRSFNLNTAATNGYKFSTGATLETGGALTAGPLDDGLSIILNGALGTNSASWNTGADELQVGVTTGGNSLTITNGATATAAGSTAHIGEGVASSDNSVTVGGSNSQFTVNGKLFVGEAGDRNELSVEDGAMAIIATTLTVGQTSTAQNNQLTVSGANSLLTSGHSLTIGKLGSNNSFTMDQGTVYVGIDLVLGSQSANNRYTQTGGTNTVAGVFVIGETKDASGKTGFVNSDRVETTGNLAIVEESATLDIIQGLTVGLKGSGSILTIRDGGTVNVAGDTVIGEAVGDNYIYLQRDADTRFNVAGDLIVGKEGGSNRFAAYGGTANIEGSLYLGSSTNQHEIKNFIHVETTNAVINVANAIHIGASTSINTLDLVDGAKVNAQDLFVGAYAGVSNNVVTISGDESLLSVSNSLTIGSSSGSNNVVNVGDGGTLFVANTITIGASTNDLNNRLNINDDGTLRTLDWDFAAISSNILFNSGSRLELSGTLSGTNQIDGGLNFVLNGTNALWDTGTNALYVGIETDSNSLSITNGALATTATDLYIGKTSSENVVTVGGNGSLLDIGNDLFIGTADTDSSYNTLEVLDGAQVNIGQHAYLYRGATLKIDSRSHVAVAGDYEQDQYSTLSAGISSNATPPLLEVAGTAAFEKGTTIEVYDNGIGDNTNVVQTIVQAGKMTFGGELASTGLLPDYINIKTNLLLGFTVTVSNNSSIVIDNFIKRSVAEAAGLEGMLADVAGDIETLAEADDELAIDMLKTISGMSASEANTTMENYYGEKQSSAPAHNMINQGVSGFANQLTKRGDNTRARMEAAAAPAGAAGPHQEGQELQGWLSAYATRSGKDASNGFDGYDGSVSGFIIGADLSVYENILMGIAGGSGSATADKDNGATSDAKTTYLAVYASTGTKDWYLDGSVMYGGSSIDNMLGSVFDTTASYDAQNIAFYLGGGKEMIGNYLIITPQASVLANLYKQDAYEEQSTTAVARSVDSFDTVYFQSSVGCNLAAYMGMGEATLKPELRAHWLHEFNASDESLPYTLLGGTGSYTMLLQAPEEDILKLGAGLAAKVSEYLELRADLDTQWASDYSDYTLLGSIRYQF